MKKRCAKFLDPQTGASSASFRYQFFAVCFLIFFSFSCTTASDTLRKKDSKKPPVLREIPATKFRCSGRPAGYYADLEAKCQVYHMCDSQEKQFSYLCPDLTLFNQKFMICDHWYAVNCSKSEDYYHLNEKIGKASKKKSTLGTGKNKIKIKKKKNFNKSKISFVKQTSKVFPSSFNNSLRFNSVQSSAKVGSNSIVTSSPLSPVERQKDFKFSNPTVKPIIPAGGRPLPTFRPIFVDKSSTISRPGSHFPPSSLSSDNKIPFRARASDRKIKFRFGKRNSNLLGTIEPNNRFITSSFTNAKTSIPERAIPSRTLELPTLITSNQVTDLFDSFGEEQSDENNKHTTFFSPSVVLSPPHRSVSNRFDLPPEFNIDTSLVPPQRGPVVLRGDNQEIRTPLSLNHSFSPRKTTSSFFNPPKSFSTNNNFNHLTSNKQFFISPSGEQSLPLSPPRFPPRQITRHHMTMTFPNDSTIMRRRRPLKANQNCPRCHPAFLKPNSCHPCVIIK